MKVELNKNFLLTSRKSRRKGGTAFAAEFGFCALECHWTYDWSSSQLPEESCFDYKTLSLAQVEGRHRGPPGSVCLLCGSRFPGKVKVILLLQTIVEIWLLQNFFEILLLQIIVEIWLLQSFVEARIYSPVCVCLPSNWQTLTSPSRDSFAT